MTRIGKSLIILICISCIDVFAHHGWSYYRDDVEKRLTIIELRLRYPHDQILAKDESNKEWDLLLAPPSRNRRFGFDGSVIEVGDEIFIVGQQHVRKNEIKIHCIYKDNEKIYTYRYPNGQTSFDFMRIGRDC